MLRKLSKDLDVYDNAYTEAMVRIEGQTPNSILRAKQVLSWITYAKRPLSVAEIRHALVIESGQFELDEGNMPEIDDMISLCAGLATVDE